MVRMVFSLLVLPASLASLHAQESAFNVVLRMNTESAEQVVALYEGLSGRPQHIAQLRGSLLALATTAVLAQQKLDVATLERSLDAVKFNQTIPDDVFRVREARENAAVIKELLLEIRRRNFAQKVVSTVEQLFPAETRLTTVIPVYFVAFGHNNIDAYVQRVVWRGETPVFVGEGQGELSIVVNLAKAVHYGHTLDERFIAMVNVVAHEVFHAAFGAYKDASGPWRQYYAGHRSYLDELLDLAQNEGIAYYLTLVQQSRGKLRNDWLENVRVAFVQFNKNARELLSSRVTNARAREIIRLSNTSGYWQSYGAITGMIVARQIDQTLGREALVETIARGPVDFFWKYVELARLDNTLPPLSEEIVHYLSRGR